MKKTTAIWAAALAAFAAAGTLQAHHSGSMYQATPIWVSGTVVQFDGVNPHTLITLEERSANGQVRRWRVEGPGQSQIERMGIGAYVPNIGDTVTFCAFPYKSVEELSRIFPDADFSASRAVLDPDSSSPRSVAGHVMITADGEKRLWEPHGVIGECIRSSDEPRQSWVDFLNASPRAREAFCEQRGYALVQSNASLRDLVEEINGSIDNSCG